LRDVAHEHGGEPNRRRARAIGVDLESEGGVDERVRVGVAAHHFEGIEHRALGGYRKGGAQHHQVWLESVPLVQKVEHVHGRPNACDCRDHCQRDARDAEDERDIGWEVRVALGEDQVACPGGHVAHLVVCDEHQVAHGALKSDTVGLGGPEGGGRGLENLNDR